MDDEGDDTKRRSRNLSEKKRRDQFNTLVNELSMMVSSNSRKMDKSTVLKATIAFLKTQKETSVRSREDDIQEDWKPGFLSNDEFTHLILEAIDGFIMVFSATGHIQFVSDSVTSLLGHLPAQLLNRSVFDLTYNADRPTLYNLLQNPGTSVDSMQAAVLKENQITFECHIRRGSLDFREDPKYELVQFVGYFRSSLEPLKIEDTMQCSQDEDTRYLFICTGRLQLPQLIRDMSIVDPVNNEFTSRHSLEWKYLFLDHRAPPIIGYLPFEVLGTSGYDYYHLDDLEKVATCHEALIEKGELTSCYYRFLTKGQQWIWLQSRFYITYHQWNSKPECVVCTHRVVSYADVVRKVKEENVVALAEETCSGIAPITGDAAAEQELFMKETSPSYMSEGTDNYKYHQMSHSNSVKSGGSTAGSAVESGSNVGTMVSLVQSMASSSGVEYGSSWSRTARSRYGGSDTASAISGESRISRRRRQHVVDRPPEPQQVIGVDYLEPAPYVVPLVVTPAQMHLQDQLQRKHEELQQMIVLQQEELRRVSEQLVMARLGILPPSVINVPYSEELATQHPQLMYEGPLTPQPPLLALPPYSPPPHHSRNPHYSQQH